MTRDLVLKVCDARTARLLLILEAHRAGWALTAKNIRERFGVSRATSTRDVRRARRVLAGLPATEGLYGTV